MMRGRGAWEETGAARRIFSILFFGVIKYYIRNTFVLEEMGAMVFFIMEEACDGCVEYTGYDSAYYPVP